MKSKLLWTFTILLVLAFTLALGVNAQDTGGGSAIEDIFEFKGYSLSPDGSTVSVGFFVNYEAKAAYEAQVGHEVEIGNVFASYDNLNGQTPLDENGQPRPVQVGKVLKVVLNSFNYLNYDFLLTGFTQDFYSHKIIISPYVYDGANVYYFGENGTGADVPNTTYNEILQIVHDHSFENIISNDCLRTPADCTSNATYFSSCADCGFISSDWFEVKHTALGHNKVKEGAVSATCTTTGATGRTYCTRCGETVIESVTIPATGHSYTFTSQSSAPTLNSAGKKEGVCTVCGDKVNESVDKLTATRITTENIYDITTNEYNPALNNIWKIFDGNIASSGIYSPGNDWFGNVGDVLVITLDQEMYLSSVYAYVVGNYTSANIRVKDAKGNVTASGGVLANSNANGGDGTRTAVISNKNVLAYTIEIEITSLKWESAKTFKLSELEIYAADIDLSFNHTHVYRDFVEQTVEPTCTSNGAEAYACYCGKTTETPVPMLPHNYDALESVTEATCTQNGKEIYSCACGATNDVILYAKGHIYERFLGYSIEPTVSNDGMGLFQCIGCDLREERVVPMLPLESANFLRVTEINGNTVTLKFNILGDPANYEVRYSTSEITESNYENATVINATVSGTNEITIVIQLNASLENCYYVAVRPYSGNNIGAVSSVRVGGDKLIPIDYSDDRVYHGETLSSFERLFDEQSESTKNSTPSTTLSRIFTDDSDLLLYGMSMAPIVDLEYMHYVSNVYVYFGNSGKTVKVRWSKTPVDFQAEDSAWDGCYSFTTQTGWTAVDISEDTRYIQIVFEDGYAPAEMLIYGFQNGDGDKITYSEHENATIGEMMGMCGFVAGGGGNTPIDSVICSTVLREYHNFGWSYDLNAYLGKPAKFEGSWMCNFDTQYRNYTAAGINVIPCIQWDLVNIVISNKVDENKLPVIENNAFVRSNFFDRFDPHTYFMYADSMFTLAARYGSNSSKELASIAAQRTIDKTQVVGLGYIKWIELGNEPDGSWNGVHNYYSAYQYAALLSAGYDGHCGTLISSVLENGYHFGVKTADPNMGVAMAGIAAADCNYVNSINYWMKANRADGLVAYDAFNGHHYMAKQVIINGNKFTVGISPEEGNLKEVMSNFVNLRNKYYSDKEVWITEFGWDTNQSYTTETSAHAYAEYTGRQVQAMWLTRAYLLLSSCGVDKATMYMCEDAGIDSEVSGKYGTCGVIGFERDENGKTVEVKKDSYYYLYTLKNTLGDFSFKREITAYDENVLIYEYESKDGRTAYAVWCKTSDGTKSENYLLNVHSDSATLVEAVYGDIDGVQSTLTSDEFGYVRVNVSENPVYVLVD